MPFEADATVTLALAADAAPAAADDDFVFEGHVDFYGYHPGAQGWFFGGWLAHPWPAGNRPQNVVAYFAQAKIVEHELSAFYHRVDVEGRGIGFVFYLHAPSPDIGPFERLGIEFSKTSYEVLPTRSVLLLAEQDLPAELEPVLAGGEEGSQRREMLDLLIRGRAPETIGGFVDCYGYHAAAGGWLFCGWAGRGWREGQQPSQVVASFEQGDISGESIVVRYPRYDLKDGAEGIVFFVPGASVPLGSLCSVGYEAAGVRCTLFPGQPLQRLREPDLVARLRTVLLPAPATLARDSVLALLARLPYTGQDTLGGLGDPVFLEIDEAIVCEPDGLVLMGWCLAKPGVIREIRVRCGSRVSVLDLRQAIRIERTDVITALAAQHGFEDARCGFLAFVPRSVLPDDRIHLEVETVRRELGFRGVPRTRLSGISAIRRILEVIDPHFADLRGVFDRVMGPAVQMLNRSRLLHRPETIVEEYGRLPADPRYSVIVPLYGRMDFVEYQLALFSEHPAARDVEFIYVLDDPAKRREAQSLFASVYERFRVPFRAVLLDHNVGFAPANNIGLEYATGEFVAFVNSDVFPGTPDWLERLAARLAANPGLGVVGPVLLFEDGSIQHQGMHFVRLREFGNWFFPMHGGKGMRTVRGDGLRTCISITGACMVMRRELARKIGGFDETYVIGDFEDSDLCLKLQRLGYDCAVDRDVHLYHLERKSQASSAIGWRMNLTLYNAWQHERRWSTTIAAQQSECAERVPERVS